MEHCVDRRLSQNAVALIKNHSFNQCCKILGEVIAKCHGTVGQWRTKPNVTRVLQG